MGLRVLDGRWLDSTDVATSVPVTVINESFARRMWPGQSAIGKHITSSWSGTPVAIEVVGVLKEIRTTSITGDIPFAMFIPYEQHRSAVDGAVLVVRANGNMSAVMTAVRRVVADLDPQVAIARVGTMDDVVSAALAQPLRLRFFLSLFASLALALGMVGVYGVVSYAVARRRAEFGIRMALGASPVRVLGEVVARALAPVAFGVVAGLIASRALARVLTGFLYGVSATDPTSLVAAGVALLVVGVLAALAPALRAGHTSPVDALRSE
jgi:ABC-type antimicrobial peptide transport system permease subunit